MRQTMSVPTSSLTFSQILRFVRRSPVASRLGMRLAGAKAFAANPDECRHSVRPSHGAREMQASDYNRYSVTTCLENCHAVVRSSEFEVSATLDGTAKPRPRNN